MDTGNQYLKFREIYETGVNKYIPYRSKETRRTKQWFNNKYIEVKKRRDMLWNSYA